MYYQRPQKKKTYRIEEKEEGLTLTLENGTHLWVNTPHGTVKMFMTKHYRSVTSWVEETNFTGFYLNGASKKTHLGYQRRGLTNMIELSPKQEVVQ